jgi:hypothetical protein
MCSGYCHEAIPVVAAAFEIMGNKTGVYMTVVSDDPAVFEPDRLKEFGAVVANNTPNGTVFLTREEQDRRKGGDAATKQVIERKRERLKRSFFEFG